MTKDYAKNKRAQFNTQTKSGTNRGRHYSGSDSFLPPWAWLTLGMIIGFFLFGLIYWKALRPEPAAPLHTAKQMPAPQVEVEDAVLEDEESLAMESEPTRFDFYTILPNMSLETNEVESRPTPPPVVTPQKVVTSQKTRQPNVRAASVPDERFIVQVASFRAESQAESLKAKLALNGFESKIQSITMSNNQIWYRVYIGPFKQRADAKALQIKLESKQKMNSFVLKINV